jgi:hypothetical protein
MGLLPKGWGHLAQRVKMHTLSNKERRNAATDISGVTAVVLFGSQSLAGTAVLEYQKDETRRCSDECLHHWWTGFCR